MRRPWFVLGAVLVLAAVLPVSASTTSPGAADRPAGLAQGAFQVQALAGGFWLPVADLWFGGRYTEESVALPAAALSEPRVRVRLVQRGGGAAHVDRVALGESAPLRLDGASEAGALGLALRADHDVLDAFGRTLELTFPTAGAGATLRLNARVEGPVIAGSPFAFPPENQFRPLAATSAFYRYRPAPGGHAPAWPEALDARAALFAVPSAPTTGHPEGTTWGWVANDCDTLYAAVDFTPDNTCDGDKDWAGVQVATASGIREFRVSERETRWGAPSFGPTPRAPWRHKLYRFAIPFSELGARDATAAGELKLAFSAYGTAAVSWLTPSSWDFGSVTVGTASPAATFTIRNGTGTRAPSLPSMTLGSPWFTRGNPAASAFLVDPGTCGDGVVLAPMESCSFQVTFGPSSTGRAEDVLSFYASFGGAPQVAAPLLLAGNGVDAAIPSLGKLGLVLLGLVLAGAGLWALRRS
ncbi:MAG: hypothetical protein U0529_18605 [Thermoanaerobaculia bacterium]